MSIQQGNPATFEFSFRRYNDDGEDIGAINLGEAEFQPIEITLRKPGGELVVIANADITQTDPANGLAEWTAPVDTLDTAGTWKAQARAGEWRSRVIAFPVVGPNL